LALKDDLVLPNEHAAGQQRYFLEGHASVPQIADVTTPQIFGCDEFRLGRSKWYGILTSILKGTSLSRFHMIATSIGSFNEADRGRLERAIRSILDLPIDVSHRPRISQEYITKVVSARFGSGVDTGVSEWRAAHGDFHWANIIRCEETFGVVDWELLGSAPRGFDLAYLALRSLDSKETVDWLSTKFGDVLWSRPCRLSILAEGAWMLGPEAVNLPRHYPKLVDAFCQRALQG
jgi:hypothetical protein